MMMMMMMMMIIVIIMTIYIITLIILFQSAFKRGTRTFPWFLSGFSCCSESLKVCVAWFSEQKRAREVPRNHRCGRMDHNRQLEEVSTAKVKVFELDAGRLKVKRLEKMLEMA